jgi:2-dehydro-3-deoxygluconokinase
MGKKTLSIGGATYDLFVRLPKDTVHECKEEQSFALPLGAKIRVDELIETCGGGASNTSVGLSRLGCDACFEGIISSDQWGEKILAKLAKEGVDTGCVTIVEDEVSSFSIILSGASGERVILYESGTNKHLRDSTFDKAILNDMDWVYLNHIQEESCEIQDDIVEMLAVDGGPRLTWNPGGCQIDAGIEPQNNKALLAHTDLLLLNKQEALAFTKTDNIQEAIRKLIAAGVSNVAITDGSRGVAACDGNKIYNCPVVLGVEILDTTGAGDAFGTGVTWGLLSGLSLPEALKTGTINAASVVGAIGTQTALLTDTEITKRLEEIDLNVSSDSL